MAESEKKKLLLLVIVLVAVSLLINQWQGHDVLNDLIRHMPSPPQQEQRVMQPRIWAALTAPTRVQSVPSELSFAPDNNGNYAWTDVLHPTEDAQFTLESGYNFNWDLGSSASFVDIAYLKPNGEYVAEHADIANAVRFRIKPGIPRNVDMHLTSVRLSALPKTGALSGWPSDWKPNLTITAPSSKFPAEVVHTAWIKPLDVFEIKLEPGFYVYPDQTDVQNFIAKYGDDVSCRDFDLSGQNNPIPKPEEVHGSMRMRFRVNIVSLQPVRLYFVIKH